MSEELRTILEAIAAAEGEDPNVLAEMLRTAVWLVEELLYPHPESTREDALVAYAEFAATSKLWLVAKNGGA